MFVQLFSTPSFTSNQLHKMASPFNLLTAGARFDRSRFQKDIQLFNVRKSSSFKLTVAEAGEDKEQGQGQGKGHRRCSSCIDQLLR
jgi:hypothetical protein